MNYSSCKTGSPVLLHLLEFFKFMSTESVMPSNHLILCCPLLLLPSIFPSIRVFPNGSLSDSATSSVILGVLFMS